MALKGLTNSEKIISTGIYGHCCSNKVLEEHETEATFVSTDQNAKCPEDINRLKNLCTGLATFIDLYLKRQRYFA